MTMTETISASQHGPLTLPHRQDEQKEQQQQRLAGSPNELACQPQQRQRQQRQQRAPNAPVQAASAALQPQHR